MPENHPEFDDLIAQAQALVEGGENDQAINHAIHICLEVLKNDTQLLTLNRIDAYKQIYDVLNKIRPDEVIRNPGTAYAILALCVSLSHEDDPYHLAQSSKSRASEYGWTDFHTQCYYKYYSAPDDQPEEAIDFFRGSVRENPAAWFYIGLLNHCQARMEEARDAYALVPENDPNYIQAMLNAGECWEADHIFYEAEEYYQKALDAVPRNREVRLAYLSNHIKVLLEEAVENGFQRERADRASEFIGNIYRSLSGSAAAVEKSQTDEARESDKAPLVRMSEEDLIFLAKAIQMDGEKTRSENRKHGESINRLHEELKGLREKLETYITASGELIRKHVLDQLQLTDVKLADCEQGLRTEHSDFWERLSPASMRYLATGCYILDHHGRNALRLDYSCAAIEFTKALETELHQHFVDLFISYAEQRERGPNIFDKERDQITIGAICYVLEMSGLKTGFAESLGKKDASW